MRSQALRAAALRVGALRLLIFACFFVLAGRAAWLTVVMNDGVEQGDRQIHTRVGIAPNRGLILDRDGHALAVSVPAPSIYVVPEALESPESDLIRLADALDVDRGDLAQKVIGRRGFRYVARWVTPEAAARVEALDLEGVGIDAEPRRTYPSGPLAASVVGFANIDGDGVRGIEQMMDAWLKGSGQTLEVQRDARGALLSDHTVDPRLTSGGDVRLSLDAGLQALAEEALDRAIESAEALGGLVLVMDPRTGDLLTLAERPGFDPNTFRTLDYAATRSRAFSDAVEPGSTFKALLVASALDAGAITRDQLFDTADGKLRVRGKTIHDHDPYGEMDAAGILHRSSNVGAVMIGQALGPQRTFDAFRSFGFGESTGSGSPDESAGIIRNWKSWKPVDAATISFGQGVGVTAIQLASAMATLANDGQRMQPRLVLERRAPGETWEEIAPVSRGQVISPDAARSVLDMMTGVVGPYGTGRLAGLHGMKVAGKTGTAQKLDRETGRYSQRKYIAWFMAAVPADDPQVAVVVAIDEPQGPAHTGGAVAAPVFAQVATDHLAHLGFSTYPEPVASEPDPIKLAAAERFADHFEAEAKARAIARAEAAAATQRAEQKAEQARQQAQVEARAAREQALAQRAEKQHAANVVVPADSLPSVSSAPPQSQPIAALSSDIDRERPVLVPDFTGAEVDQATKVAAMEGLDVRVVGSRLEGHDARVVSQVPRPGTIIVGTDRTVMIELASTATGGIGR